MSTPAVIRVLLAEAIDYAGLFPPAQLDMAATVANYRRYRNSPEVWALGRLVVPVARLEECAAELQPDDSGWPIAAVATVADPETDAAAIAAFNARHGAQAVVDVIEAPTPDPAAIEQRCAASAGLVCYCELDPAATGFEARAAMVGQAGGRAKLRTGGVRPEAIPPVEAVARFIATCERFDLVWKATAGLHHGVRGDYALTYEPAAACGRMHGFMNVMLAVAMAANGDDPAAVLEWTGDEPWRVERDAMVWHDRRWSLAQIEAARRRFAGFGSCSFEEPLACVTCL